MAHDTLLARLGLEIGMLCEKLSNFRLDRLGQQRTRAAAQDLRQGIGEGPGWVSLITLLSDTAYHSFIVEVEALNTTTIRRLTRSCRHQLLAIAQQHGGSGLGPRSSSAGSRRGSDPDALGRQGQSEQPGPPERVDSVSGRK